MKISRTIGARRTVLASVVAAGLLGLTACASDSSDTSKTSAADEKITLTVGAFGTFGFKEAGLYDEYMKLHPNITVKEQSVEQEQTYYQALQTRLAAGSGLADVQAIEVGRIADVVANQADKWVDLNTLGAAALKSTFFDWKWNTATTKDGKTLGLGTDIGPQAICFRSDLFKQAGLSTDREELAKEWATWQGFIDVGKKYMAKAPKKSAFIDSAGSIYSASIGQNAQQYYDANGGLIYETNPAVKQSWDLAMSAASAGITAKLKQFDPAWNQGFSNGAFATVACPAWMIGYIKGQAGDGGSGKWDVAQLPGGSGNWGGSYLGIPKAGKHQKEAYELVKWLTAPEQQVTMWTKGQHFPSSSTAAKDPAVANATDTYFSNAPIGKIFDAAAEGLPVAPVGPKAGAIANQVTNGIVLVEQQGKSGGQAWQTTLKNIKNDLG
jgi:cellobiose transport system substrate-binding protein